ncbi:MAG: integrase [Myxococcota bacterium]|jgi:integrase
MQPGTISRQVTELGQLLDAARTHTAPDEPTVAHLSRDLLRAYLRDQRARGITASIINRVQTVERFWSWTAVQPAYRDRTPAPERISSEIAEPPRTRKPAPTWSEMDLAVLSARDRRRDAGWYGELFTVARYTGLRCGQIMRLEWRDISLDEQLLTIRPELGKSRQERRGRLIPVSPHLAAYLAGLGRREGRIVHTRRQMAPNSVILASIYERSGIRSALWKGSDGRKGRKLHLFRHGLATNLVADGQNPDLVRILLGHSAGITLDIYTDSDRLAVTELRTIVAAIPAISEKVTPMQAGVTAVS